MIRSLLLIALAASLHGNAQAASKVVCHVTYGGAAQRIEAQPVASPYKVPVVEIGSYFLFRIVLQTAPRELAAAKIYTYADQEDSPVIIHQASHPWPAANRRQYGFTGLQRVYEPMRDGELEYWCEAR
ncbi:hypothetical protein [Viridibacterium curvum]|uniref:Uncharacterized protein n=1 Tax=Viridibacterium curvum TaxID=1101404 RepID=A0ABP9QY71_9RHOO